MGRVLLLLLLVLGLVTAHAIPQMDSSMSGSNEDSDEGNQQQQQVEVLDEDIVDLLQNPSKMGVKGSSKGDREGKRLDESEAYCLIPKLTGPCRAQVPRYYFDQSSKTCLPFVYGGCGANLNNFETLRDCEKMCRRHLKVITNAMSPQMVKAICEAPPSQGPSCEALVPRWTYNATEGKCMQFYYGGCGATKNNFISESACQSTCDRYRPADNMQRRQVCDLEMDSGPCYGLVHAFYFNKEHNRCEKFTYGGCQGNGNRFRTAEDCQRTCGGTPFVSSNLNCQDVDCELNLYSHYTTLGCTPAFDGQSCCPTRFDCPDSNNSIQEGPKCVYKGRKYSVGEAVDEASSKGSCRAGCVCQLGAGGKAKINCAMIECPENFGVPEDKRNCTRLYKRGDCCSSEYHCPHEPDAKKDVHKCIHDGEEYIEGQVIYPRKSSCLKCYCKPGFSNESLSSEFCEKIDCGIEIHYSDKLEQGCVPIYYQSSPDAPSGCCPIGWECPQTSPETPGMMSNVRGFPPRPPPNPTWPTPGGGGSYPGGPMPVTTTRRPPWPPTTTRWPPVYPTTTRRPPVDPPRPPTTTRWPPVYPTTTWPPIYPTTTRPSWIVDPPRPPTTTTRRPSWVVDPPRPPTTTRRPWNSPFGGRGAPMEAFSVPEPLTDDVLKTEDDCALPKAEGTGKGYRPRYYYNKDTGRCELFIFTGVNGNNNNFGSIRECSKLCEPVVGILPGEFPTNIEDGLKGIKSRVKGGLAPIPVITTPSTPPEKRALQVTEQDPCLLPKRVGRCKAHFPRYYYNPNTDSCDLFIYGGCQGNGNNFVSIESCQAHCISERLPLEQLRERIENTTRARQSPELNNQVLGQRLQISTPSPMSILPINESVAILDEVCSYPPATGLCKAHVPRWHYDPSRGKCSLFVYGGCGGNQNNFLIRKDCEDKCSENELGSDVNILPIGPIEVEESSTGSSTGGFARWRAAPTGQSQVPEGQEMSILDRGANILDSRLNPHQSGFIERCKLPKKVGSCYAIIPQWYYDVEAKECLPFNYSGCFGNPNKFPTKEECENECKSVVSSLPIPDEPSRMPFGRSGTVAIVPPEQQQRVDNEQINEKVFCQLPPDSGFCMAHMIRYHWDPNQRKCLPFTYGGCRGNKNNFISESDCISQCGESPTIDQLNSEGLLTCTHGDVSYPLGARLNPGQFFSCGTTECECITPPALTCIQRACPPPVIGEPLTVQRCPEPTCHPACERGVGENGCPNCKCPENMPDGHQHLEVVECPTCDSVCPGKVDANGCALCGPSCSP